MLRVVILLTVSGAFLVAAPQAPKKDVIENKVDTPFFALWSKDDGNTGKSALRFAYWDDGRVLFAKDSSKWGSQLQKGKLASYRVTRLKEALASSGVFSLKGNCYLVPDGGVVCLIVNVGDKKEMMYWDEVDSPRWGINVDPKPRHIEFMRCWKVLNSIGLVACPDQFEDSLEIFKPAQSWYFKKSIQSE